MTIPLRQFTNEQIELQTIAVLGLSLGCCFWLYQTQVFRVKTLIFQAFGGQSLFRNLWQKCYKNDGKPIASVCINSFETKQK